jgi:hypothetical protein
MTKRRENDGTHKQWEGRVPRAALTAANDDRGRSDPASKRSRNRARLGWAGNRGDKKAGKRRGQG